MIFFDIIQQLQVYVTFHKVKAHANNNFNNKVDQSAKNITLLTDVMDVNTNHFYYANVLFSDNEILSDIRGFVKEISHITKIFEFFNLNRNTKYQKYNINWVFTFIVL